MTIGLTHRDITQEEFDSIDSLLAAQRKALNPLSDDFIIHTEKVIPKLDIREGETVWEIGHGNGLHLRHYSMFDYRGTEIDPECHKQAVVGAFIYGIDTNNLYLTKSGEIPTGTNSVNKLIAVTSLHESPNIEADIRELDRVMRKGGTAVIVERSTVLYESEEHQRNLSLLPELMKKMLGQNFHLQQESFKMDYWGLGEENPQFDFYMLTAWRN